MLSQIYKLYVTTNQNALSINIMMNNAIGLLLCGMKAQILIGYLMRLKPQWHK
jgi:hypothetical protein